MIVTTINNIMSCGTIIDVFINKLFKNSFKINNILEINFHFNTYSVCIDYEYEIYSSTNRVYKNLYIHTDSYIKVFTIVYWNSNE